MHQRTQVQHTQRGIGLIEVLVALVVVSVGVLGLAGLQLNSVRVAKGSFNRSQAVVIAETVIAQMRANPDGVADLAYNGLDSDAANCSTLPSTYCNAYYGMSGSTPVCSTAAERAANDFFEVACGHWNGSSGENGVIDSLPGGRVTVDCNDAPCSADSTYTVAVSWTETEVHDETDVEITKQVEMRVLP
ncbi:type IV pilus modification protein PilV [Granulosicoccaceae sp. 1_MG-2023]|nr:type IV pilus modification protein PilV [Granulosicoccaceae sp. 1_MG-2023]